MSRYSPEYLTSMKREPMSLNFVRQAIEDRAILEARVIKCDEAFGLTLEIGKNIYGYIPFEELEYSDSDTKISSATSKVNKRVKFIAKEISKEADGSFKILCSRKESQKECIDNFISKLIPGDVIDAKALKIMNYGIFCDIGCGITALLPTNCISVTHIVNPVDILKGLGRMKVVVKDSSNPFKVQLSHKELLGTWVEETKKFCIGDIVPGMVLSIEDYGVFVRLSQNLSGLAEPTELNMKTGDLVSVQILDIKPENMKVRLNIEERLEYETDEEAESARKLKFKYVISDGHIDEWTYSTETAKKQIKSTFNE